MIGNVDGGGDGGPGRDEAGAGRSQLVSPGASEMLDLELGRDSELRLLVVVVRVSSLLPRFEPVASVLLTTVGSRNGFDDDDDGG